MADNLMVPDVSETSNGGSRPKLRWPTGGEFDLRNSIQIILGAVLVPLGIVVILFAWYGAAHASHVQQQIPYLVSGSFIGLGLMIVGGLLYWAHWLYRMYDQADLHHTEVLARQEELFELLMQTTAGQPSRGGARAANGRGRDGAALVRTATGSNVHRRDCPIIQRHPSGLRPVDAGEQGLKPCRICNPLAEGVVA